MEGTEPTTGEKTTGRDGVQEALIDSKPLHRFVQKEPRILGIVILIFGCGEILMGFHLIDDHIHNSTEMYIPFWQGALFITSGSLSIYTEIHPSKKTVTMCLAMYVVSLLGIVISVCCRIYLLSFFTHVRYYGSWWLNEPEFGRIEQLIGVEAILFTSSLCVSGIFIFLCAIARLAVKSTRTKVIIQRIPAAPQSNTSI